MWRRPRVESGDELRQHDIQASNMLPPPSSYLHATATNSASPTIILTLFSSHSQSLSLFAACALLPAPLEVGTGAAPGHWHSPAPPAWRSQRMVRTHAGWLKAELYCILPPLAAVLPLSSHHCPLSSSATVQAASVLTTTMLKTHP